MKHNNDTFEVGDGMIVVNRRGKRGKFTARFRHNGENCRRALKTASRPIAERRAWVLYEQLINNRYEAPIKPTSLTDGLDMYIRSCTDAGRREVTTNIYQKTGETFIASLKGKGLRNVGDVTALHLDAYIHELCKKLHRNTVHLRVVIIKQWFNHLTVRKIIKENPLVGVKNVQQVVTDYPAFRPEQVRALIDRATDELAVVLTLMLCAGMRVSEAIFLRVQDVDMASNFIRLVETPERKLKTLAAKRDIPIHPHLRPIVVELIGSRATGLLFRKPTPTPGSGTVPHRWTSGLVNKSLQEITDALGYPTGQKQEGFTSHALRRTAYTEAHLRIPEKLADLWFGHAAQGMSRFYFKPQEQQEYMERLPFGRWLGKEGDTTT